MVLTHKVVAVVFALFYGKGGEGVRGEGFAVIMRLYYILFHVH